VRWALEEEKADYLDVVRLPEPDLMRWYPDLDTTP
jgi:hypothetical protein